MATNHERWAAPHYITGGGSNGGGLLTLYLPHVDFQEHHIGHWYGMLDWISIWFDPAGLILILGHFYPTILKKWNSKGWNIMGCQHVFYPGRSSRLEELQPSGSETWAANQEIPSLNLTSTLSLLGGLRQAVLPPPPPGNMGIIKSTYLIGLLYR